MTGHDTPIRVDHVGIAVRSIADAEPVLQALGCEKRSDEAVTADGSVPIADAPNDARFRWAYYVLGDASRIELLAPLREDSNVQEYLDDHGPGLHHVTLEVADIDAVIDSLKAADLRVVDHASYEGWTEAFVSPRNPTGALFQLMEYDDDYAADRGGAETLYVHGEPVEATDA